MFTIYRKLANAVRLAGGDTDDFKQELIIHAFCDTIPERFKGSERVGILHKHLWQRGLSYLQWLRSRKGAGNATPHPLDDWQVGSTDGGFNELFDRLFGLMSTYPQLQRYLREDGRFVGTHSGCNTAYLRLKQQIILDSGVATAELERVTGQLARAKAADDKYRRARYARDPQVYKRSRQRAGKVAS